MKVVCDNCRSVYKIPDDKLVKPVNKATCRKCGHRMLIPRPRQGASPDEKTLVTAVPPTPNPAPMRDRAPALIEDDDGEATLPGVLPPDLSGNGPDIIEEVPLFAATPIPAPSRSTPPPAPRQEPARSSASATPVPATRAPQAAPPARSPSSTPPAAPARPAATPSLTLSSEMRTVNSETDAHDPSGDLTFALVANAAGWLGALALAVAAVAAAPASVGLRVVGALGSLLVFGGLTASLLVLLTSSRGRRPAKTLLSGAGGAVVALLCVFGIVGGQELRARMNAAPGVEVPADPAVLAEGAVPSADTTAAPATEAGVDPAAMAGSVAAPLGATSSAPATAPAAAAGAIPAGSADVRGPVAQTFAPRAPLTGASGTASPAPAMATPTPAAPAPAAEDEELTLDDEDLASIGAAKPSASAAPALPSAVADSVIDTILRSNAEIKRCFYNERKASGSIPAKITVSFMLEPSGRIRDASVSEAEYRDTELAACLSRVLPGITMPASSGADRRVTYPFRTQ